MDFNILSLEYSSVGLNANSNPRELFHSYDSNFGYSGTCVGFNDSSGVTCLLSDTPQNIYLLKIEEKGDDLAIFVGERDDNTDVTMRLLTTELNVLSKMGFSRLPDSVTASRSAICPDPGTIPTRNEFNIIKCEELSGIAAPDMEDCLVFEDQRRTQCVLMRGSVNSVWFKAPDMLCTIQQRANEFPTVSCTPNIRHMTIPIQSAAEICGSSDALTKIPVMQRDGNIKCVKRGCISGLC